MNNFRSGFGNIPPVVKNLLIINVLFFLATLVLQARNNFDLNGYLGLYYPASENFKPVQFVTYMFLHGSFFHLFFNMFALYMFGRMIEMVWGPKRFFIYYFVTGIGAAITQLAIAYFQAAPIEAQLPAEAINAVIKEGPAILDTQRNWSDPLIGKLNLIYNIPMVGASGAIFGILLAFGMLFPNVELMLLFPPIPIKAKYMVIFYGLAEFYFGVANRSGDNVAHFAHLGGMLFGIIFIFVWNKHKFNRLN
ncbi:MAG: rhomboid family intramembrane serine protease [Bacteroidetes bacterium GWF2_38_335]|nr:MAG: rhomboid family intramembrane serine protease [Bacteroidetes bacterium GWF2_38_335]OFY80100.1 MAG: rhomboid family intramembrane serine protease [Bacteroidetes bacterium RIFOXYA12_FULL_38_20]HBS88574.1 rhomboid family intramembrane serine protease [Bacteroidales bacterium]